MKILVLSLLSVVCFSCTTKQLIKNSEYADTNALYKQSEFDKSLQKFPTKEKNGFITSVEKSWLSLWNQKGDNSLLETQIKSLDQRQYTSISQEAEFFFFNETADGYIPSEHEVISLHLINSMIYMQQKNWNDAEVEARRASYFLQKIFNPDQPHFDDPALRLWLAAIWISLDNWDAAQVDLRRIYEMTKNSKVKKLLSLSKPPPFFRLSMRGSGPELVFSESSVTPEFVIAPPSTGEFGASPWYQRHLKRNTVIRDTVLKSNYMAQYLGVKTNSNSQRLMGYSFGGASKILGVTLGGAVIAGGLYLVAQSGLASNNPEALGYIFIGGIAVGKYFWETGDEIILSSNQGARDYEAYQFDKIRVYRYVRFLPNYFGFELTRETSHDQSNKLMIFRTQGSTEVEYLLNP